MNQILIVLLINDTAIEIIDKGVQINSDLCTDDIDGMLRDLSPDIGADEY